VCTLEGLTEYLDDKYPDVGCNSPLFPVLVVVFCAAVLGTRDHDALSRFTGYTTDFIRTIAWNMRNSKLWSDRGWDTSRWLSLGEIVDDDEFWDSVDVAQGNLWFDWSEGDPIYLEIEPGAHCQ
jgi:hypothetical protein